MKVFVLAVAIMVLTAAFVWWCGWYVNYVSERMIDYLEKLPEKEGSLREFGEVYTSLEREWFGSRRYLRMIFGKKDINRITECLVETGMRYIGGDISDYNVVREKLLVLFDEMKNGERISLDMLL
ncbi:MAG: DUF4363 family protein [Ruminococcaceae bacterium]|nr:DUF4363 family protein [Oscillospiraceae bacterium]